MAYEERQLEHPRGEHPIDVTILYTKLISFSWISSVSYQIVRRRQYESGHSFDACQRQSNRDGYRARVRQDCVPGIVPPTGFCERRTALHALTHSLAASTRPSTAPELGQFRIPGLNSDSTERNCTSSKNAPDGHFTAMSAEGCLFTVRRLYRLGFITVLLPGSRVNAIKPDTISYTFLSSTFGGGGKNKVYGVFCT